MTLFKKAENMQAYLKAGLLGFGGSGKTYTSYLMAKGIYERLKEKKPVYMMDTETGSDFLVPWFKQANIPFHHSKSRAFLDLLAGVQEAEANASVLIIDSISHFWTELMAAYAKKLNRKRLQFQDWAAIKQEWRRFTDAYLNSKVHIIMCGRAGYEYDYFTDEAGDKQLEKTGTKMKAEGEMSYEPSLLIEMLRAPKENPDKSVAAKQWDHVAIILKDRTTLLEGRRIVNPTFKDFEPVFDFLNIGGEHVGIDTGRDSTSMFEKDSPDNWQERRKQVEILKEEIQGELTSAYPGRSTEEVKAKTDILAEIFDTRSWAALDDKPVEELRAGLEALRVRIAKAKLPSSSGSAPKPEKKEKEKVKEAA